MADSDTPTRIFRYNDHTWEDPGPEFSIADVKAHLAAYFPELSQAEARERTLPDGRLEITFVKQAGWKGSTTPGFSRGSPGAIFDDAR